MKIDPICQEIGCTQHMHFLKIRELQAENEKLTAWNEELQSQVALQEMTIEKMQARIDLTHAKILGLIGCEETIADACKRLAGDSDE